MTDDQENEAWARIAAARDYAQKCRTAGNVKEHRAAIKMLNDRLDELEALCMGVACKTN